MALSELPRLYPLREEFISEDELKDTARCLEILKYAQSEIASESRAWIVQRKKTIESVENLEKRLQNLHMACSAAHGVGSAMEAVGGLALLAGTILTACGHKNVGEFLTKEVSTVSTVTGMATSLTSSLAETGLTAYTMNEAKELLQSDKECTGLLIINLENSKKIDSRLSRIFNCSVLSDVFIHVVRLVQEGIVLLKVGHGEISELMAVLERKVAKNGISGLIEIVLQNVENTLKNIMTNREASKAVWNICKIIRESPLAIEAIKISLRITYQIFDILKVDVFSSLLGLGVMKTSSGVMATKCLLGTVQVAVNVFAVISAVQNAQEETKYLQILKELKRALSFELKTVQKNFS